MYVGVGVDYGSCYYEGDSPEIIIEFFKTESEAKTFTDKHHYNSEFKKVPDHV